MRQQDLCGPRHANQCQQVVIWGRRALNGVRISFAVPVIRSDASRVCINGDRNRYGLLDCFVLKGLHAELNLPGYNKSFGWAFKDGDIEIVFCGNNDTVSGSDHVFNEGDGAELISACFVGLQSFALAVACPDAHEDLGLASRRLASVILGSRDSSRFARRRNSGAGGGALSYPWRKILCLKNYEAFRVHSVDIASEGDVAMPMQVCMGAMMQCTFGIGPEFRCGVVHQPGFDEPDAGRQHY